MNNCCIHNSLYNNFALLLNERFIQFYDIDSNNLLILAFYINLNKNIILFYKTNLIETLRNVAHDDDVDDHNYNIKDLNYMNIIIQPV